MKHRRPSIRFVVPFVLLAGLAHALSLASRVRAGEIDATPLSEPMRHADKSFAQALWLYADGDVTGALAEFRRAYAAFPNFKVLYNIAALSHQVRDWAGAMRTYRKYLATGGDLVPPERRARVEAQLAELGQKVGRIQIDGAGAKFEITVDDQRFVLSAPDQAVEVNPGRHQIRIVSAQLPAQSRTVDLASGERLRLVFETVPVLVAPPKPVVIVSPPVVPVQRTDPR